MLTVREKRIHFTFFIFCIFFLLVLSKAFYVQVVNQKKLLAYSDSQFLRQQTVYPKRGNIYDRKGAPLAINIQTYSLFTIPRPKSDNMANYVKLVKIIPQLKLSDIKKKIHKRNRYTWLIRKIKLNPKQIEAINKLEGIFLEPSPSRFYPNQELLSQTLGFVGVDNVGLSGMEFKLNKYLKGEAQIIKYLLDAKGRPVKFETNDYKSKASDVYLSIEKDLQAVAEKYLKQAVIDNKALKGGIGVMDVKTGEVLAISNYPNFDPNNLRSDDSGHRKLSFVSDPFEPGSIFKILTVASALENKIASSNTNYFCEYGKLKVENHTVKEAESSERFEWLSVSDIIVKSSNIGTTKIAFDLTFPHLKETLQKFSIGRKTGIQMPGESRGIFPTEENVSPLALSNISFGQGVATTGIQMLAAYAAIANDGLYVEPTILKRRKGEIITKTRIMKKETAKELTQMLELAVEEGTGSNAKIKFFKIAGKTGTAQKASAEGRYEHYISSFIGFPVNIKNRFVIFVYIDEPKDNKYYGNLVAAPVFKQVAQYLLYKKRGLEGLATFRPVPQDEKEEKKKIVEDKSKERIKAPNKVPNFVGLDKVSSQQLATQVGLKLKHKGIGVVINQFPLPGELISKFETIELNHAPPQYE